MGIIKVMAVIGTRPEAVKMAPLLRTLHERPNFAVTLCASGQQPDLLPAALEACGLTADLTLPLAQRGQTPQETVSRVMTALDPVLADSPPDVLLVHGDTVTALAAAMAGFFRNIPVAHVEAGLRTHDLHSPYPEEFCRQTVSSLATWHFCPTPENRENLLREGRNPAHLFVTGNTGIDALLQTVRTDFTHPLLDWCGDGRMILMTVHRRESIGKPLRQILRAAADIVRDHPNVRLILPVHLNPDVANPIHELLGDLPGVRLTDPLPPEVFQNLLARAFLVMTDSGSVQEEAMALGRPTLVLRDCTERPEGSATGGLWLTGRSRNAVRKAAHQILSDPVLWTRMHSVSSPYGDGHAAERIADILEHGVTS